MKQLPRNMGYLRLGKSSRKRAAELPWLHTVLCSSLLVCWVLACCYLSALLQKCQGSELLTDQQAQLSEMFFLNLCKKLVVSFQSECTDSKLFLEGFPDLDQKRLLTDFHSIQAELVLRLTL